MLQEKSHIRAPSASFLEAAQAVSDGAWRELGKHGAGGSTALERAGMLVGASCNHEAGGEV